jgi:hypothetical protein
MDDINGAQKENNQYNAPKIRDVMDRYWENPIKAPQIAQAIRNDQTKLMLYDSGSSFLDFLFAPILGDKQFVRNVGTHKYALRPVLSKHASQQACTEVVKEFRSYCKDNNINMTVVNFCHGPFTQAEVYLHK